MALSRQSRLAAAARRTISAGMRDAGSTRNTGIARRKLMALLAALPFGTPSLAASPLETGMLPWHHLPDGTFRNPQGSPERGGTSAEWRSFMWRRLVERAPPVAVPDGHVLPARAALAGLEAAAGADSVTWLGHASFLIRLGGRTILTDPFLSERASPFAFLGPRRLAGPSLGAADLPPVDILLLSHNHYDHLDLPALQALRASECATAVMPLRVSRYLETGRFAAHFPENEHRNRGFHGVEHEREGSDLLASGAKHVGRADVTGAYFPDIAEAGPFREQEAERDGPAQIADDHRKDGRHNVQARPVDHSSLRY